MTIDEIPGLEAPVAARLRALRAADPEENLRARLRVFETLNPDWTARRFGMVPRILEHGFATVAVDEGLVYTLGLHYRFELPEIMIVDRRMPDVVLANTVNRIAQRMVEGSPPIPGEPVEELIASLTFFAYVSEQFERYPCGYLYSFYRFFADEPFDDDGAARDPPVLIAVVDEAPST